MELNHMQYYQNTQSGDLVLLFTLCRKRRNGDLQVVYQDTDLEYWVESVDKFKEKFIHKPIDHSLCKVPGCKEQKQGFYPYCKNHG